MGMDCHLLTRGSPPPRPALPCPQPRPLRGLTSAGLSESPKQTPWKCAHQRSERPAGQVAP